MDDLEGVENRAEPKKSRKKNKGVETRDETETSSQDVKEAPKPEKVAMVALRHTVDLKNKPVPRGRSFYASFDEAEKLVSIGAARFRTQKDAEAHVKKVEDSRAQDIENEILQLETKLAELREEQEDLKG